AIAQHKLAFLEDLPSDPSAAVTCLADHEFLDEGARQSFEELLDMLQQHVMRSHFDSISESLRSMTADNLDQVKDMIRGLNGLLHQRAGGEDPDIGAFMEGHGRHFRGAESIDDIIGQLQTQNSQMDSLLGSM